MSSNDHRPLFPVFLRLEGRPCVVIGGGKVAARKVQALLEAGARVRVIAPALCPALEALRSAEDLVYEPRPYQAGDLRGACLAFAATGEPAINAAVFAEAERLAIPVNAVDDPAHCTFLVPSRIERPPVAIAVSTGGASPALARHLREVISQAVPAWYGDLAALLGRLRPEVMGSRPPGEREHLWEALLQGEVPQLLAEGKPDEAEACARRLLGLSNSVHAPLVIGTRGSRLALVQAKWVADRLEEHGVAARLQIIRTQGDGGTAPLETGAPDLFVREIEHALLAGEIGVAVHSLKDLPTGERPGLAIAAIPEREDPRDCLVAAEEQGIDDLAPGSLVATSSPRRRAQLRACRPDLKFVPVRGNVDTRLAKLERGDFQALVVAMAALRRLGLSDVGRPLPYEVCLPAPGQGALALQVRADDEPVVALLKTLDHAPSRLAVTAERGLLARLGGGCAVPVSALATVDADRMLLRANVAEPEGCRVLWEQVEGPAERPEPLADELAGRLLAAGASTILEACRC